MRKAQLPNGIKLHYLQVGEGPDLVMIHGFTGNLASWHLKMVPMLRDTFRVLTYDLRGHGHSDVPPTGYSAGDMAADLEGLLDVLEIEKATLVGHSYGADTALYFALKHPERVTRVVAIEAGLPALIHQRKREDWEGWKYWTDVLTSLGQVVPPEHRADFDYLIRLMLNVPYQWGPATGRPRKPDGLLRLLDHTTVVSDYEVVGDLTLENVARIQTPVHLIFGEGSAFLGTFEYLRTHLPNRTATTIPSGELGHFGVMEQPEALVQLVLEYCRPDLARVAEDEVMAR